MLRLRSVSRATSPLRILSPTVSSHQSSSTSRAHLLPSPSPSPSPTPYYQTRARVSAQSSPGSLSSPVYCFSWCDRPVSTVTTQPPGLTDRTAQPPRWRPLCQSPRIPHLHHLHYHPRPRKKVSMNKRERTAEKLENVSWPTYESVL